jgi:hypothetical protein
MDEMTIILEALDGHKPVFASFLSADHHVAL